MQAWKVGVEVRAATPYGYMDFDGFMGFLTKYRASEKGRSEAPSGSLMKTIAARFLLWSFGTSCVSSVSGLLEA